VVRVGRPAEGPAIGGSIPGGPGPKVGVGGDIPFAKHDLVDAARRDVNRTCQCILTKAHRLEELFKQDFAGVRVMK